MKNQNSNRGSHRKPMRTGVALAVLSTLMAGGAHAANINDNGEGPTVNAYQSVLSVQDATLAVTGFALGQSIGITVDGPQVGTSNAVTLNLVGAGAIGNSFSNNIDLSLTGGSEAVEGVASLGVATNSAIVSSSASDNRIALDLNGFSAGGATNTANAISASTTVNSGSSTIAGTVPIGYVSTTPGMADAFGSMINPQLNANGSMVVASTQSTDGPGSSATAADNEISLGLTSDGDNVVSSGAALSDNTISATLKVNSARNTADIRAGEASSFNGSAVVANVQRMEGGMLDPELLLGGNTASNLNSAIVAGVVGGDGEGGINVLQGQLAVRGNAITSSVTGNEALGATPGVAGNSIILGDGMSFAGIGGATAHTDSFGGGGSFTNADLAILNVQRNEGALLGSTTQFGVIGAMTQSLEGGTIDLSGNSITAAASGNAASSAMASAPNGAAFAGTTAVSNQQVNEFANIAAVAGPSIIAAWVATDEGTTLDSTVAVNGNNSAASAYGNTIRQSLSLDANTLALGGAALVHSDGDFGFANAAAIVFNQQINRVSSVSADNMNSTIGLSAGSGGGGEGDIIRGSTLSVDGNTQEAIGVGSSAANTLSLAGTTIGSGAGISNTQSGEMSSFVEASLAGATASVHAGTHVAETGMSLTDNLQRAIGYGNSASNLLAVSATSVNAPINTQPIAVFTGPSMFGVGSAGFNLVNNQLSESTVSANTSSPTEAGAAMTVLLDGELDSSSVRNEGNAFVAAAYGNDALSGVTLAMGNGVSSGEGGLATVANLSNMQSTSGAAVTASATGGPIVVTRIAEDVLGSMVSTSNNSIEALGYGSRAGNALSVEGNDIGTSSPTVRDGAQSGEGVSVADAAFSVNNAQWGSGSVTATQRTGTASAAEVRTEIGGAVVGSTVALDGNTSIASATSNGAGNSLTLAANHAATSSALQNSQTTSASVNALTGQPGVAGTAGTPAAPFAISATGSDLTGTTADGMETLTGGTLTVVTTALTQAQVNYLTGNGWTVNGSNITGPATMLGTIPFDDFVSLLEGGTVPFTLTLPGQPATAAVAAQGGVTLAVGGPVIGSQLSVDGNSISASVAGNSASNGTSISANSIAQGSGRTVAVAGLLLDGTGAQADHALSNVQEVTGGALTNSAFGRFAIDAAPGGFIADSTLSVSDNSQRASAVANMATNSMALSGNNVSTTSALASTQSSAAAVSAISDMEVSGVGAAFGSTLALSGNRNMALGVINDVSNTLTVTGSTIVPVGLLGEGGGNAQLTANSATGDHVLSNRQVATTQANGSAVTRLLNGDPAAPVAEGLSESTLVISGNSTTAEASANRADNAVTLNGAAVQNANAGISNSQASSAGVMANAVTQADVVVNGNGGLAFAALNQGTVTVDGNITNALARGNFASNVLNGASGASSVAAAGTAGSAMGSTQAMAAVQNTQSNSGPVSATSSASYQVALNATGVGSGLALSGGAVAVQANSVAASAYGNSAVNSVQLSALNNARPTAAVGNYQTNSGPVMASAMSVTYGIGITGGAAAGSLRTMGNQVTATAVGNSATSSISAAR